MTVSTLTTYNEAAAGGTVYYFTFRCDDAAWVKTYVGGVLKTTGITVALNADQEASPGGSVTFGSAATGTVRIERETALTQETNYTAYGAFPAETHELALDKGVLLVQDEARDRADADAAEAATRLAADLAEAAARAAADAAIIASGNEPANVGIAPVIATGSTEVRTVADRFADVVNVKDFGAVGDGTTDDTDAIQAAVTAAGGGGCVYFPTPGTYAAGDFYRTTAPINVTGSDVTLLSDAADINGNSAVIKNVTSGPVIAVTGERFSMRRLDIMGDDANIDGVTVTSTSGNIDGTIRNCTFGYLRQAVKLTGRNFHVTDNIFGQCQGAVEMVEHGTGDSRDFFIERNQLEGMGLQTAGGLAVTFKIGANVFNVQVIGNFAYQGRYAKFVTAATGAKKITVQGNVLDALNNSAVEFGDVEDIAVQGNVFRWATPWSTYSPYAPNCYGIVGGAVARGAVQNNLLVNCPHDGIYFNGICTDFSVQGNTLVAPGCKTANTYDGIRIPHGSCAMTSIIGNLVDAGATAMRYGINWGGGAAAENHVHGNIVYGAATANYLGAGSTMVLGGGLILGPGPSLSCGAGAPTDNTPVVGSLYLRTDGGANSTLYVKTGATTWTAK